MLHQRILKAKELRPSMRIVEDAIETGGYVEVAIP